MADTNTVTLTSLTGKYALNGNGDLIIGCTITPPGSGTAASYTGGASLKGFKSGSISFSASSVDNSARGDGGWAVNAAGSRSATLDVTFNRIIGDAAQDALISHMASASSTFQNNGFGIAYITSNGTTTKTILGVFVPTEYSQSQSGGGDSDGTAEEVSFSFGSYGELYVISST